MSKIDRKYGRILDVPVDSTSTSSVLKFFERNILAGEKFFVTTPNPEVVMLAQSDPVLKDILNKADLSLPDGVGLVWASKLLIRRSPSGVLPRVLPPASARHKAARVSGSLPPVSPLSGSQVVLKERVSGVDVMEELVKYAAKRGWRMFLLGGMPGVAAQASQNLKIEIGKSMENGKWKMEIMSDAGPWLGSDGKPINKSQIEKETKVIEKINKFRPQLLFVGFGAPKQEKWASRNLDKLNVNGVMVVGGAFDYISGKVTRAPVFIRKIGFEWLFRLIIEPWRLRRQLALIRFVWAVLQNRFK